MSDANRKIRLVKSESREEGPDRGLPEALDLEFVYPSHSVVVADEGPDSYIHAIDGKIEFSTAYQDMETGEYGAWRTEGGRFHALYVDAVLAEKEGVRLSEVMNAESTDMAEIYRTLYAPNTNELRAETVAALEGGRIEGNLLVVLSVEILPPHRGMGLGLAVLWYLIRLHSAGCGIVVLKASPRQYGAASAGSEWNQRMAYGTFAGGAEQGREKLVGWSGKLGFRPVGNQGIMAFSKSADNPVPNEIHHWVPRKVLPAGTKGGVLPKGIATPLLVGMNLKRLREEKGWSQLELARKLGVTAAHVDNVESGGKGIGLDRIEKWAHLFDVAVAEFFMTR
jgi:DNA-binding XRE family transcriptional regulator